MEFGFWSALYIFVLTAFLGYELITRVPVILHTPLMSGSNFIHGVVVVGAMAMVMYELFSWIEKRTTGWAHRGSQGE